MGSYDPVHDVLLHLYIAAEEAKLIAVSAVGPLAGMAPTTALRWINVLEAEGIVIRTADPGDRRRSWLTLAPDIKRRMDLAFV